MSYRPRPMGRMTPGNKVGGVQVPPSDTRDFVEIPGLASSGIVRFVSRVIELQSGTRSVLGDPAGSASEGVDG